MYSDIAGQEGEEVSEEIIHNAPNVASKVNILSKINQHAKAGWKKFDYGALKNYKVSYYESKTSCIA